MNIIRKNRIIEKNPSTGMEITVKVEGRIYDGFVVGIGMYVYLLPTTLSHGCYKVFTTLATD